MPHCQHQHNNIWWQPWQGEIFSPPHRPLPQPRKVSLKIYFFVYLFKAFRVGEHQDPDWKEGGWGNILWGTHTLVDWKPLFFVQVEVFDWSFFDRLQTVHSFKKQQRTSWWFVCFLYFCRRSLRPRTPACSGCSGAQPCLAFLLQPLRTCFSLALGRYPPTFLPT